MSYKDKLTEKQIQELKHAFELFDTDRNGSISMQELGTVMKSIGQDPTQEELVKIISGVDKDGNGEIDLDEFLEMMAEKINSVDDEEQVIRDAFAVFDTNQDGYIEAHELQLVLQGMDEPWSQEDIDAMIKEADLDGNGKVDLEEFTQLIRSTKDKM